MLWGLRYSSELGLRTTFILSRGSGCQQIKVLPDGAGRKGPTVFSDEALSRILAEADRIVYDAHLLLDKAQASGESDLVEAAHNNLRLVIENRDRLNRVFSLCLATAEPKP